MAVLRYYSLAYTLVLTPAPRINALKGEPADILRVDVVGEPQAKLSSNSRLLKTSGGRTYEKTAHGKLVPNVDEGLVQPELVDV